MRTLQDGVVQPSGSYSVVWDSTLTDGSFAPEGAYTAVVQAVNTIGTIESVKAVTVDLTPPVVTDQMISPSLFMPPAVATISFGINEPGTVSVSIYDSTKVVVRKITKTLVTGSNSVVWDGMTTGGTAAAAGTYTVKLSVNDLAYNKATVYLIVLTVAIGLQAPRATCADRRGA